MALPFFYVPSLKEQKIILDEDTSKHVTSVLRMKNGEELMLTDGQGKKARSVITDDHRKRTAVEIISVSEEKRNQKNAIGISLLKNNARFEWFLEKATEMGMGEIIPLVCERTEKEKFGSDRMKNILIIAMLQSQQSWMPELREPVDLIQFLQGKKYPSRFIAHCIDEEKSSLASQLASVSTESMVLIGPEGDFSPAEIEEALKQGFVPVSLGSTRLRTETAGLVAAVLLSNIEPREKG
jgi:16S rRNA (uracil1498-N3)-methyltransferase